MRRIISLVMVIVMIFTVTPLMLSASDGSALRGDLNGDGRINVKDCNMMKRYHANAIELKDESVADIDNNGVVNAVDSNLLHMAVIGSYIITQPGDTIADYTVVCSENATVYETYAAEILCDYVYDNFGYELNMTTDATDEVRHEILIGDTSRVESETSAEIGSNQYLVKFVGDKIVLKGKDYMVGGAVGELCYKLLDGEKIDFAAIPETDVVRDWVPEKADSVILMIGDGMGFNHINFAKKWYARPSHGRLSDVFIAETFQNRGECTTYSLSNINSDGTFQKRVTDSAAGATALATGWKTQNGKLGINALNTSVQNVRELAHSKGMKTAVISTEVATGATPSGFTVHNQSRGNAAEIAAAQKELVDNNLITYLGSGVYDDLLPTVKEALDEISTSSDGFYAMIEEAHIDKACDSSYNGGKTLEALAKYVYRFNTAIQYAATFTAARPGTVLIITADHETGALNEDGGVTNGGAHTDRNVPVFAMGAGTEIFNGTVVDNTDIAKFTASVYSDEPFGGTLTNIK